MYEGMNLIICSRHQAAGNVAEAVGTGGNVLKLISEGHTVKVLIHEKGAIVALTTKRYSYLFFISRKFVGMKKVITADRIVAQAGYDVDDTLDLIRRRYGW